MRERETILHKMTGKSSSRKRGDVLYISSKNNNIEKSKASLGDPLGSPTRIKPEEEERRRPLSLSQISL